MKTTIKSLLAIAVIGITVSSCGSNEENTETEAPKKQLPLVEIAPVQIGAFTHQIKVQGDVKTDLDAMITSEASGILRSISVKEGQKVRKGQVLARIDGAILASNAEQIRTSLKYAEYMLEKQEELNKRGVGSEIELEGAKNQVNSLRSQLNTLGTQQGKTAVRAPFTGVIDQVIAKDGQMASPAQPLFRLVNNESVDIVSTISEKHIANVSVGKEMEVSFPNYMDTTIILKISNVGNYIEPINRTFRVKAHVPKNTWLLPNMLAEVKITDLQVTDGTVVESKSILKDNDGHNYLYILNQKNGKKVAKKVVVDVISSYEGKTLVKAQDLLTADAQVVVAGALGIADNEIVRTK